VEALAGSAEAACFTLDNFLDSEMYSCIDYRALSIRFLQVLSYFTFELKILLLILSTCFLVFGYPVVPVSPLSGEELDAFSWASFASCSVS